MSCVSLARKPGIMRLLRRQVTSLFVVGTLVSTAALIIAAITQLADTVGTVTAQQQIGGQDLTLHSDNGAPRGIWSDGSTMWVADFSDRKLYAYSLSDAARLVDKDLALGTSNFNPLGLWSDGITMWVLNASDDKIYGYTLADRTRNAQRDISLDIDNDIPMDIWSDRTTMYVLDQNDRKLYAYALSDGERQSDKDITIGFDRPRPVGVWSNGSTFWISYDHHSAYTEDDDFRIYAFNFADGSREVESDVQTAIDPNRRSLAIWSDGTSIWVTDKFHRKLFAYTIPRPTPSSNATLEGLSLSAGTLSPTFTSTTTTYTASVDYAVTNVTVSATTSDSSASVVILDANDSELSDLSSMEPGHQLKLEVNDTEIRVRVTAEDDATVQTYSITVTRARPVVSISSHTEGIYEGHTAEFSVMREIAIPEQLDVSLSVSETESLLPSSEKGTRTATIPSGATSTLISLSTDTDDQEWEAHSAVTVSIEVDDGYQVSSTASSSSVLVLDDDFPAATATISFSPNPVPEGATATATIIVTTHSDSEPHGAGGSLILSVNADSAQAEDLSMLDESLFDVSPEDFSTTTVDGGRRYSAQYSADITIEDDSIVEVGEAFEIELSKATSSRDSLMVAQPSVVAVNILDNDAALSSLELSGVILSPEFAPHIHRYEAHVDYPLEATTVAATTSHADSTDPVFLQEGIIDSDGVISLSVGENEIGVEVVAEDTVTTATYVVNVTRTGPKVRVKANEAEVDEGQVVEFLVSRNAAVAEPLLVDVTLTGTGTLVSGANLGTRTVTIPGGSTAATTTVPTHPDDDVWEPHSVVTAEIESSDFYEVQSGAGEASTLVRDNDFPQAQAVLNVAPSPVSEGATVSATLTVTTRLEEEPHGIGGTMTIAAHEGTAQAADYGRFGETSFTIEPDDFALVEVSGAQRYQASYTAALAITDDRDSEPDESFQVVVTKTDAPQIELTTSASTTVVISANDSSTDPTLSQLRVSPGTLSPMFSSTSTQYSVALGYGIERVTISPVVNSDYADVDFLDVSNNDLPDANTNVNDHQVDLKVGQNTVRVKVTAEDNVTTKTYTIVLTRLKPEVSLSSNVGEVAESNDVVFTLARNAQVSDSLNVIVDVDESDSMVADMEEGRRTVTIPRNSTSTSITVSTEHDDRIWEPHSAVNATISASSTYAIKPGAGRAETLVKDDDFPESSATLSVNPPRVSEGANSTLSITVTTTHDQDPHGHGGTLTLAPVDGTAKADDYGSVSQSAFSIVPSDFSRIDIGNGVMVYRAVYSATVETIDDSESEGDETVVFQLGKGSNSEKISTHRSATATLTILANDASSDASLSGLGLSTGTLSPPFASSTTSYTASVPYGVQQASLEYTRKDRAAEVTISDADDAELDDADSAPGFQVNLAVGSNVFKLSVTSEDESAMQTYTVTITRSKPTIGIFAVDSGVPEGGVIEFKIARSASVAEALDVIVDVAETYMLLAAGEAGQRTVTIPSEATTTSFTLTASTDDDVWEEHSTVTASIVASTTYDISGGKALARIIVEDDDFPDSTAALDVSPNPLEEGEQLTTRITVTTKADQQPHGDVGTLILRLTGDTALPNDFEIPHEVEFDIAAMDFLPVVVNGSPRYRASYTATTTITDDEAAEPTETFIVAVSTKDTDKILLPTPSTATVTIASSDLSDDSTLGSLSVSHGTLSPEFASSTTDYTVLVGYSVESVIITPVATDGNASILANNVPVNSAEPYLTDLPVGSTTVEVIVTAQDSVTVRTYSFVIVRARPVVGITPVLPQVSEGSDVRFSVSRNAAVSDPLELRVDITESGDLVPDDAEGSNAVTIPPGATSTILTVATDVDDDTWEEHSTVSATLTSRGNYLVNPDEDSAEVEVRDNDFPEATASLSVSPNPVAEGENVAATITVRTRMKEQPHRNGGTLMLAIGAGSAQMSDYGSLSQSAFSIGEADFVLDVGSNTYVAEYMAAVEITEDNEVETGESFDVSLSLSSDSPAALKLGQSDMQTISIRDFTVGLAELDLSGVELSPQFSSDTLSYTASVAYSIVQTVVSATTTEASHPTPLITLNGLRAADGRIPLSIGENLVSIEVMPKDPGETRTYVITVTREKPKVNLAASTDQASEGSVLGYIVSRSTSAPDSLAVQIEVGEAGDMIPPGSLGEGSRSVIIPAWATSTSFAVETDDDDDVWDAHSTVTVSVIKSELYVLDLWESIAETQILDDDFPESVASMTAVPSSVMEGESVSLEVVVTTLRDEVPHADGGPLTVATGNDSAVEGTDYVAQTSSEGTLRFLKDDFVQVEESGQTRYRATKLVRIDTLVDDDEEGIEKFVVILDRVTEGPATTSSQIALDASSQSLDVTIKDAPDAELSSLALSEGALIPPLSTSTRSYTAEVSNGVEHVTVMATTSRAGTRVTFHDRVGDPIADLDNATDGHQVPLVVGENTIRVQITAANSTVLDTYTVTVTRVEPVVSISASTTSVVEGDPVAFRLHRDSAPSDSLLVPVSVAETGAMLASSSKAVAGRSVTIPGHATSSYFTVVTDPDDEWEEHSIVSASIASGDAFAASAESQRAEVQVTDDDFPAATATLAVGPNPVVEGREVFATVTVTTRLDQEPHSSAGAVRLSLVGVSATSGDDFTPPQVDRIAIAAEDFQQNHIGGQARYSAVKKIAISTVDDDDYEGPETFTIQIGPFPLGPDRTAEQIEFDPNESLIEVTISDNDDIHSGGGGDNDDPPGEGSSQTSGGGGSSSGSRGSSSRATSNHSPKFEEGGETSRTVEENSAIGTKVGARIRAADRDGDRLTYSLHGDDRSSFTINESTGRLYTATSLDREADSRYYLTVAVSDGARGTDSIEVTIVVTDVNEPPTVTGEREVSYPEQTPGVLATYTANDPESAEILWSLSDGDAEAFDIHEGALTFRSQPDFEMPTDANRDNAYELTVRASDGVHTSALDIVVIVTDVDESPSPTPTPFPTSTPEPRPTPSIVPTVTPTVKPTSTPGPVLAQRVPPAPVTAATVAPVTATPTPTVTRTPAPMPTVTPTPVPSLPARESQKVAALPDPTHTSIPTTDELLFEESTLTAVPTQSPTPRAASPTTSATPDARPELADEDVVPASLLLSIMAWAILATGAGVFFYMRHR